MIDLDALKARLAEYDDARPRCQGKVARTSNCAPDYLHSDDPAYPEYAVTTYSLCCRPEGHAGECRNSRSILGWPGFVTVSALVAEVERLRVERDHCRKAMEFANAEAERMRGAVERERSAVVAFMRAEMRSLYENGQERPAWFVLERKADAIERGAHRREVET